MIPVALLLAVVTLVLLLGLIVDFSEVAHQIPVNLLGLVTRAGGGLHIYRVLRQTVSRAQ